MWDSPLDAMNIYIYYHWLIKKLFRPIAGQNIARLEEIQRESGGSQRDAMKLPKEKDARMPEPYRQARALW